MTRMRKPMIGIVAIIAVGLVLSACAGTSGLQPTDRTVYMAAIEPKGTTSLEKEPFPTTAMPPGGGYELKEPDEEGNWVVQTYRFMPGQVTVVQGDRVTLEIVGINGASHPGRIEGYNIDFDIKRGEITRLEFTADKAGIFRIICHVHQPAMEGSLVVLPA